MYSSHLQINLNIEIYAINSNKFNAFYNQCTFKKCLEHGSTWVKFKVIFQANTFISYDHI